MSSFNRAPIVEIGPAEVTDIPQGDEGPQEIAIRERMEARRRLIRASRDHQAEKMTDDEFDEVVASTHYRINR